MDPAKISWSSPPPSRPRPSIRQAAPGVVAEPVTDRAEISALKLQKKEAAPVTDWKGPAGKIALLGLLALSVGQTVGPAIHTAMSEHKATVSATQQILEHDHDLTPDQHFHTVEEMRQMHPGVIQYLAQSGLELQITQTDSEVADMLRETGRLHAANPVKLALEAGRVSSLGQVIQNDPELARLGQREAELDARVLEVQTEMLKANGMQGGFGGMGMGGIGAMGFMGSQSMEQPGVDSNETGAEAARKLEDQKEAALHFGGGGLLGGGFGAGGKAPEISQEMLELGKERFEIGAAKQARIKEILTENGVPEGWAGPMPSIPMSLEQLVSMSGAQSDTEKAEFRGLFELANSDRLAEARQASLEKMEANLERVHPQARAFFEQQLKHMKENPEKLPLDRVEFGLLVPDLHYQHLETGESLRLRGSDRSIGSIQAMGLYLPGDGKAQVDHVSLNHSDQKVVIHELGHALDFALEQNDPEFYKEWSIRRDTAFAQAKAAAEKGAEPNTHYGLTNTREYIAEGIEGFYKDPEHLKDRDPALYELTAELLGRGGQHVSQKHKSMHLLMATGFIQTVVITAALVARANEDKQRAQARA